MRLSLTVAVRMSFCVSIESDINSTSINTVNYPGPTLTVADEAAKSKNCLSNLVAGEMVLVDCSKLDRYYLAPSASGEPSGG
jgi:hypothetical protein